MKGLQLNLLGKPEPYLLIERHSVAFNYQAPSAVDVGLFQAAVEASALWLPWLSSCRIWILKLRLLSLHL
jgi:hypothetical protein